MTRAFVKRCRAVATGRDESGLVLLDGDHVLRDALDAGVALDVVLTDGRHPDLVHRLETQGTFVIQGSAADVASASPVRTSSGIVALARWACRSVADVLALPSPLIVGLVGVQDPGNVGSIIRSAEALGASGVVALGDTADPAGWKALRGAMGSTFRLPIGRGSIAELFASSQRLGIPVTATVPAGGMSPTPDLLAPPLVVLFGGEGQGLTDEIVAACDRRLTIPMRTGANSLNVGVSAALILWEARRESPRL